MRRLLLTAAVSAFCGVFAFSPARALNDDILTDEAIQGSIDRARLSEVLNLYFAMLQAYSPEDATRMGIHSADFKLNARDAESDRIIREALSNLLIQLSKIATDSMLFEDKVDLDTLRNRMTYEIFLREKLPPLKRDPQYYLNSMDSIYDILSRDFTGYAVRAQDALARLEQLPEVLLEMERNIYYPPELFTRQALLQSDFARDSLKQMSPMFKRFTMFDPIARSQVEHALEAAKKALERYKTTLNAEVLPISDGDPRIGEQPYAATLRYYYGKELDIGDLEDDLEDYCKRYEKELKLSLAEKLKDRKVSVSDYDWPQRQAEHDTQFFNSEDELVSAFQAELERAYRFFDKKRLLVVPQERLRFLPTPAYLLPSVPYALYRRSYPLDPYPAADMLLAFPDKRLKKEQREQLFRSRYSKLNIEFLTALEIMPGKHMRQSALSKASQVRKVFNSEWLDQAWSAYSVKLALESEYFSEPEIAKNLFLRWKLIKAARALVELRYHLRKISYDAAIDFLSEKTGLDRQTATSEINYMAVNPGLAHGYVLGYEKIMELRERYRHAMKDKFDIREFHMRLLWLGNMPLSMLEQSLYKAYTRRYPALRL